jgi:drug/metabolite transporter (DMT)-like permease
MNAASKKKLSTTLQIVASILLVAGALMIASESFGSNGFVVSALGLGIVIGGQIQYYAQRNSGEEVATKC